MAEFEGRALDWDDEIEPGQEFITLPAGDYDFTVEKYERERYEGGDKMPACWKAVLKIRIDTEKGSAYINDGLFLYSKFGWKLAEFFLSIGAELTADGKVKMNWNTVPMATGRATVEVVPGTKDPTKKFNRIKKYLPKEQRQQLTEGDF